MLKRVKKSVWFDSNCREARRLYLNTLKLYNSCKTDINRQKMYELKSKYKKFIRTTKAAYSRKQYKAIEKLRFSRPKDFWKLFSKKKTKISECIPVEDFYDYFFKSIR